MAARRASHTDTHSKHTTKKKKKLTARQLARRRRRQRLSLIKNLAVVLLGLLLCGILGCYLFLPRDALRPSDPTPVPTQAPTDAPTATPTPVPTATPSPSPTPEPTPLTITLTAVGDCTLGGDYNRTSETRFDEFLRGADGQPDYTYNMRNVMDIFEADDLTIANLEVVLTNSTNYKKKNAQVAFYMRGKPEYVNILTESSIEVVNVANNHAKDFGSDGLQDTLKALDEAGVAYFGNRCVKEVKGVRIGFVGVYSWSNDKDTITAAIKDLRENQNCDLVIASCHWGEEREYTPNSGQKKMARWMVDAGADLVVGHHSHRINPIEYYNGKYICYSLGNFSFAGNNKPSDMTTFLFQIRMRLRDGEATSEAFKIIPCRISSRTDYNDFAPTPYTDDSSIEVVLRTLRENGKRLDYAVEEYPLKWPDEE
mgnify:CR=1 FL=1